jgi:hypothetical protein
MDSEGTTLAEALATLTTFERFFLAMDVSATNAIIPLKLISDLKSSKLNYPESRV